MTSSATKAALGLLLTVGVSSPALAEATAGDLLSWYDSGGENQNLAKAIFATYLNALEWANADLADKKRARIFCVPSHLALEPEQVANITRNFANDHPSLRTVEGGLVVLKAMERVFPCDPNKGN